VTIPATIEEHPEDAMKLNRIISLCSLVVSLAVLFMLFKKPQQLAPPQALPPRPPTPSRSKIRFSTGEAQPSGQAPAEVHLNSAEITAAFAQAAGRDSLNVAAITRSREGANSQPNSSPSVTAPVDPSAQPDIKDYNVNFEGDVAHGQFLTKIAGKDVWSPSLAISAPKTATHLRATNSKSGDIAFHSLVNDALRKN